MESTHQKELEAHLAQNSLDIEIDMFLCGNLELTCKATLEALRAGNKPFPACVRVFSIKKDGTPLIAR